MKIAAKNSQVMIKNASNVTALANVKDWALNMSRGTIDASTIDTEWKESLVGQISADGSMNLLLDPEDTTIQRALEDAMMNGTETEFHFRPQGTGTGKLDYSLTALVTQWNITGATEDAIAISVNIAGVGAVTRSSQTA